ncbi:MAG: TonB-dependent receptor plug domain-containing protein, partial [Bacteroidota bacterium]
MEKQYAKTAKIKILTFLPIFLAATPLFAKLSAQSVWEVKINLKVDDQPLIEVFDEIESRTDFIFSYSLSDVRDIRITKNYRDTSIGDILMDLSKAGNVAFKQIGNNISVSKRSRKEKRSPVVVEELKPITLTVVDVNNEPLIGVTVAVKGSGSGTITDYTGTATLDVLEGDVLIISYIGFKTQEVTVGAGDIYPVVLVESTNTLESVTVTGTRNQNRTVIETPVPIDVINMEDIVAPGGQVSITEILNVAAPSFTSQTQTVSDGTDHIDPATLRGLGPDQVLILINGKRRHTSALLNVNGTVGRGSVGTDMNSIPAIAIKRIEVLRDGAAAQYGSDAIAGVINIILKEDTDKLDLTLTAGANFSENSNQFDGGVDGEKIQIDANYGIKLPKGGFINLTGSLASREPALRNKDYQGDIFQGFHGAERIFAANGGTVADMTLEDYRDAGAQISYLSADTRATIAGLDVNLEEDVATLRDLLGGDVDEEELAARGLTREDFRFKVGTADLREGKAFINMSMPTSETAEFYSFGGIGYRQGLASGFYRRPAQGDGRANTPAFPNGFLPGIQSDVVDKSIALGIRSEINGWNVDFSNTWGQNTFDITVVNSSNGTLGVATPREFDAGGFGFTQNTTNLDVTKYYDAIFSGFNVAFGSEYRVERFSVTAGEENSWASYDINGNIVNAVTPDSLLVKNNFTDVTLGGGAQVYRGFTPQNEVSQFRNSIGGYMDLEADITNRFMVSLAARFESYSDFGETFNYKLATRVE